MTTDLTNHRLDHYHLLERLGGNMGDVYRAWDTSLEREVAVKVLAADLVRSADGPLRFRREAQRAAQVGAHPNVVSTFGAGEAGGWPYIAMELLRGEDLGQLIEREGALPPERALRLLEQAAAAIDHLHEQNPPIIHRDIKPANFMVLAGDRLILTDFGLARRLDDSRVTKSGTVIGSPSYMAPEQAMGAAGGAPVGKAADIYSLGAMAYEMLCGRPPFVSDHLGAVLAAHQSAPVPPVGQWRGELPGALDKVFGRALAKRAGGRQGSAGELVGELERVLGGGVRDDSVLSGPLANRKARSKSVGTAPLPPVSQVGAGTSPFTRPALAMRLGAIGAVSLAVVGLTLLTSLRVDRQQEAESARSQLATAVSAGEPTAMAIAQATMAAMGTAVANSDATLVAARAAMTRDPNSAAIGIFLQKPLDGEEIKSCSVRLVWRLDNLEALERPVPVAVHVCRTSSDGAPDCELISANGDQSTADFRPKRAGDYSWKVNVDSGARLSEPRMFVWKDGGCAGSADKPGDEDGNVLTPEATSGRNDPPTAVPPTKPRPPIEPPEPDPSVTNTLLLGRLMPFGQDHDP